MKKFLLILVLVSYTIASYGVSLNYFYCCGKLKSVSIIEKKSNKKVCKANMGKGCCKNETHTLKLKIDQKLVKTVESKIAFETIDCQNYYYTYSALLPKKNGNNIKYFQLPPPLLSTKKNILYCVYRI